MWPSCPGKLVPKKRGKLECLVVVSLCGGLGILFLRQWSMANQSGGIGIGSNIGACVGDFVE